MCPFTLSTLKSCLVQTHVGRPWVCFLDLFEFICVSVVLCLKSLVSLVSPIPSDSYTLSGKGSHGNPQTTQGTPKAFGCSPQTDSNAPLLKTTPTQFIEHREVELVPTKSLHPPSLVFMLLEGTLHSIRGEREKPTQLQILQYTVITFTQDELVQ